jgi:hypothetical protein
MHGEVVGYQEHMLVNSYYCTPAYYFSFIQDKTCYCRKGSLTEQENIVDKLSNDYLLQSYISFARSTLFNKDETPRIHFGSTLPTQLWLLDQSARRDGPAF